MDLEKVFALVRRLGEAVVDGRLEAKKIKTMSDADLAAFDADLFTALQAKQRESEMLGHEGDTYEQT